MSAASSQTVASLEAAYSVQRAAFAAHPFPSASERRGNLTRLIQALQTRKDDLARAVDKDFGRRSRAEFIASEVFVSLQSLRHARRHVAGWMKARRAPVDPAFQFAKAFVVPQPVGVVGIVTPWNYPLFLTMGPLAGALAAGNRVMLKLPEFAPATSSALADLLISGFPDGLVTPIQGDAEIARAFVKLPFDHLLFTGSTAAGREVMRAAADNLTPLTLELGGKSPALLAPDARLAQAAGSIVFGKFLNAGQTCIAPDYVLAPADQVERLIELLRTEIAKQYPRASENPDYTSIINGRQYARLAHYLQEAGAAGCRIIRPAGDPSSEDRRFPPTLVIDPPDRLALMQEEVFGPILPIKPYRALDDAIRFINERPRPLALYLFTTNSQVIDRLLKETISGGVSINDTLLHIAIEDLPFGGTGRSGFGHYHGRAGFETFSKLKPVFHRRGFAFNSPLRPPYGKLHEFVMNFLIRWWD